MSSIRQYVTVHVHTIPWCLLWTSCIVCTSRKLDVVNPTRYRRLYDLHLCIERSVHVAQFTGGHATHCARSYDILLPTVHVAKPDDV